MGRIMGGGRGKVIPGIGKKRRTRTRRKKKKFPRRKETKGVGGGDSIEIQGSKS